MNIDRYSQKAFDIHEIVMKIMNAEDPDQIEYPPWSMKRQRRYDELIKIEIEKQNGTT